VVTATVTPPTTTDRPALSNGMASVKFGTKPDNSGGGVLADAGAKCIGTKPAKVIDDKRVTESRETKRTTRTISVYTFLFAENELGEHQISARAVDHGEVSHCVSSHQRQTCTTATNDQQTRNRHRVTKRIAHAFPSIAMAQTL
jgi:hypothetical protein